MILDQYYIGTEHLLIGLGKEEEGEASRILSERDLGKDRLQNVIQRMLGGEVDQAPGSTVKRSGVATPTLDLVFTLKMVILLERFTRQMVL